MYWFFNTPLSFSKENKELATFIYDKLNIKISSINFYDRALTHSSVNDDKGAVNYERLEFLGDSVLDLVVREELFLRYPHFSEGKLTKMKSSMVSRKSLNKIAEKLNLKSVVKVQKSGLSIKSSIYGNALEALLGAVFLDLGFKKASTCIKNLLDAYVNYSEAEIDCNFKGILIEWAQKNKYNWIFESELHSNNPGKIFLCRLYVNKEHRSLNYGNSKKEAEQNAAKDYCSRLGLLTDR